MVLSITVHPPMQSKLMHKRHTIATPNAIPLGGNTRTVMEGTQMVSVWIDV